PALGGPSRRFWRRAAVAVAIALAGVAGYALHRPQPDQPPRFTRLSTIEDNPWIARFAPDGFTVLYTATQWPKTWLTSTRTDRARSVPTGVTNASILSISRSGDAALLLHPGTFD